MSNEVIFLQSPRLVGGAGTELLHLIDLFIKKGIKVSILVGFIHDKRAVEWCKNAGVNIIPYTGDFSFVKDKVIINHGQADFLMALDKIKACKPARLIYISAMWSMSNHEITRTNEDILDDIIHVSCAQRKNHEKIYKQKGIKTTKLRYGYKPYINPENSCQNLSFNYKVFDDKFVIGRLSRPDPLKFPVDLWRSFQMLKTDKPKKIIVNSFDANVGNKVGPMPANLEAKLFAPYEIDVKEFMDNTNLIFQQSGGGESWGRYVMEAFCCGVPCVLENNNENAFSEMAEPDFNFIWAKTTPELIYKGNELIRDEPKMKRMAINSRNLIENRWGNPDFCFKFWKDLLNG